MNHIPPQPSPEPSPENKLLDLRLLIHENIDANFSLCRFKRVRNIQLEDTIGSSFFLPPNNVKEFVDDRSNSNVLTAFSFL